MKTVRIKNGVVVEIIPEYALPVEQWYGESFAAQCVEAPDEVQQHWVYSNGEFSAPVESEPQPSLEERVTALEQNQGSGGADAVWTEMRKAIESGVNSVD